MLGGTVVREETRKVNNGVGFLGFNYLLKGKTVISYLLFGCYKNVWSAKRSSLKRFIEEKVHYLTLGLEKNH